MHPRVPLKETIGDGLQGSFPHSLLSTSKFVVQDGIFFRLSAVNASTESRPGLCSLSSWRDVALRGQLKGFACCLSVPFLEVLVLV